MDYPLPLVTVDAVLLTLRAGVLEIALHQRDRDPFKNATALPGGVVHVDEDGDTEASIRRVLREKTGFEPRYLEQLQVFSGKDRDPRQWSLSVSYVALVPAAELEAATQADFRFVSVDALPPLAFDHAEIIAAAVARLRGKSSYSTLPFFLLPERFTLTELQHTYEAILQTRLEKSNFRRKMEAWGVLEATGEHVGGAQRPAQLYRLKGFTLFDRSVG
ncbi:MULTISPECIES: NUDIX hydrolase [Achromobacter]|uniref:NUDIX domain-containing protein n=1 Tax=Achromobacter spanius TaxID=217203 RepID=A0ABY8H2J7_9BURK|nr:MULTISPECIES: NUDIX domain-containing protein [Achromobacter]WAI85255.1 NUDIX hydrolase [Achromobacter spanius]WEX95337.1 NUDIX hydrolase [Achromobacter sp. SS2-2022]WFP10944.1 NUDIX domain-containing protein [Achromobacter spanius]